MEQVNRSHSQYYDTFVSDCSFLRKQQVPSVFQVAPDIDEQTISRVSSTFELHRDEEVLLIRRINDNSYLLLTDQGVYHNANKELFSLKWDTISRIGGHMNEYTFIRDQKVVYRCNAAFFFYGLPKTSSNRTRFFFFMKKLPRYQGKQDEQAAAISNASVEPIISKTVSPDPKLFQMRCPECGSEDFQISDGYYSREKTAKLKHDLTDLVTGTIQALLGIGKPGRSPLFFNEVTELQCNKCYARWRRTETNSIL